MLDKNCFLKLFVILIENIKYLGINLVNDV